MRYINLVFFLLISTGCFSQTLLGDELIGNSDHQISDDGTTLAAFTNVSEIEFYDFVSGQWQLRNDELDFVSEDFMIDGTGNTIVIGNDDFFDGQNYVNKVEVYSWNGSNWQLKGNPFIGDNYDLGRRVFISNDGNRINFISQNLLLTYEWNGNNWIQIGNGLSTSAISEVIDFNDSGTLFGVALVSNDTFPVVFDVEIYQLQNNNWVQKGNTIVNPLLAVNQFDFTFSFNELNDRFVLGCGSCSDFNNTAGAAIVYEYSNDKWQQRGQKIIGDQAFYRLGTDVALDATGNKLIIGQPFCDCFGDEAGEIKLFEYDNASFSWNQTLSINGQFAGNRFGSFVDISNSGDIISAASASFIQQVRVFDVSTLGIAENQLADIDIYPNPVQDNVHIKLDQKAKLAIYSLKGEKVFSGYSLRSGGNTLDLSHLSSGVYFIKINTRDNMQTKKLIIQ